MIFYPFLCVPFTFVGWLDPFFKLYFSKQTNVLGSSEAASKNTFLLKNRAESDYKGLNKGLAKTVLKVHLRLF